MPALLTACGFVAFYLVTDLVTPLFASTDLPLPNDPVSHVRDWCRARGPGGSLLSA